MLKAAKTDEIKASQEQIVAKTQELATTDVGRAQGSPCPVHEEPTSSQEVRTPLREGGLEIQEKDLSSPARTSNLLELHHLQDLCRRCLEMKEQRTPCSGL